MKGVKFLRNKIHKPSNWLLKTVSLDGKNTLILIRKILFILGITLKDACKV